jgi:hypothetical protein
VRTGDVVHGGFLMLWGAAWLWVIAPGL